MSLFVCSSTQTRYAWFFSYHSFFAQFSVISHPSIQTFSMPTPPLPLFHQLLTALHIPIHPPSLTAIPPSLLLLTLETILKTRLPLPHSSRLCQTSDDELVVIKCVLGVLADDILGMDLSVVDPLNVVRGGEHEMAVMIMALVVAARRRGVHVKLPPRRGNSRMGMEKVSSWLDDDEEDWEDSASLRSALPPPILPDVSLSSSETSVLDTSAGTSFTMQLPDDEFSYLKVTPDKRDYGRAQGGFVTPVMNRTEISKVRHPSSPSRQMITPSPGPRGNVSTRSPSVGSSDEQGSGRTVLQYMLDELGLGLGG
ncbi:hypothetical protein J010_03080 [Cryptococcus neoformans]|uniref:DUF5745 domain-containing protein n=1 Tax=Cryptococcus neoformans Tu259-1 TaxID=1230072 RepID=A0A854Q4N4_CRYNE|nr:hypothetical protein C353_03173 [Cryptococcus neoformans var. grubii AD1-83a]OXG09892.1 hypothetical protein C361_07076 [Cryptococcus neoformans var. grubii Tu259-1]OXG50152.1 hypothetical protein C355_03116 [Cryptococcus neoformans var. grubii Th84]OXG59975.1 hypothetical protein C354_03110 [Cryptococcus neoformans var. grubii MW-RSA1955]OXG63939.1 hypothetical protein C351_02893 [Cryptococcus neoformans var. grubii c8]OXG65114.1 hypothetical protein C352_03118 [Cryptococcus neoformans var